ncbi:TnsA endonuclease N-terminal domain-containing protein [Vibrio parahaemolyticus]|uniref:TnsA endonuclease N-terminal domain-containing protein n=1 Tax=Vibrio parahaemolyticus TaxID=670 RepID=UPI00111EDECE|nr:TnsA endonuclease N-terminal domain-containing protein [Vibrio parahaemolyticus]TOK51400.1 endonuclease [Vibrio parahaemolyticus]TOK77006.1 endonuclease [Vibrio parahaemolyticus]TOK86024.1 endonuclease [Vibrio parahaemolyticus]
MFDQTKKSSHVHNICKFMSLKNDAVVRTLSILEFDFCFHLEYNADIKSFTSQPFGFNYQFNNRKCRYTPDFLATDHDDHSIFFEVKHSSQILKPDFRDRFKEKQRVALNDFNRRLVLVTDKQIRMGPTLNNFKLLHRYSGLRTVTEFQKLVLAFIQRKQMVKLQEVSLYFGLSEKDTLISTLPWISSGQVKTDLNGIGFGLETYVWC